MEEMGDWEEEAMLLREFRRGRSGWLGRRKERRARSKSKERTKRSDVNERILQRQQPPDFSLSLSLLGLSTGTRG